MPAERATEEGRGFSLHLRGLDVGTTRTARKKAAGPPAESLWAGQIAQLTFLPLGADVNTAVYRADDAGGRAFFLKLRRGPREVLVALILKRAARAQRIRGHHSALARPQRPGPDRL